MSLKTVLMLVRYPYIKISVYGILARLEGFLGIGL